MDERIHMDKKTRSQSYEQWGWCSIPHAPRSPIRSFDPEQYYRNTNSTSWSTHHTWSRETSKRGLKTSHSKMWVHWICLKELLFILSISTILMNPFKQTPNSINPFLSSPLLGIVIYLHIEGAIYAQKSVPSWFLAVFDSKIDVCWNLKKVVNSLIHYVSAYNSQISWSRSTFL